MKSKIIELILSISQLLTVCIVMYFFFLRFTPKMPLEFFSNVSLIKGLIFMLIFFFNLLILNILIFNYRKTPLSEKKSDIKIFMEDLYYWIDNSHKKIYEIISYWSKSEYIVSFMTALLVQLYEKNKSVIIIYYFFRLLYLLFIFIDIFYYNSFKLSYTFIYILLIPIFINFIISISLYFNNKILQEINKSIIIMPLENDKNLFFRGLSVENRYYNSIEEAIYIQDVVLQENKNLEFIKEEISSVKFNLFIRSFYTFIFAFIFFNYPLPILLPILIYSYEIINKIFPFFFTFIIISLLILSYSYFNDKPKQ